MTVIRLKISNYPGASDEPGYKNTVHEVNYLHHYSGGQCMNYLLTAAGNSYHLSVIKRSLFPKCKRATTVL